MPNIKNNPYDDDYEEPENSDPIENPIESNEGSEKKSVGERFKDKWNSEDETCKRCGQVTKISRGLTKQNVKRLIGLKIKMSDFLVLVMLCLVLFLAYAYFQETKTCREFLNNIDYNCMVRLKSYNQTSYGMPTFNPNILNESNASVVNETNELNSTSPPIMENTTNVSTNNQS